MNKKTKRVVTVALAAMIVLAVMLGSITPAFASETLNVLEQQQKELEQQTADAEALKNATEEELRVAQERVDSVKNEIAALDSQINEVGNRIIDLNKKIADNEVKLEQKEAELAQAQEDLKVYYAALKGRIQMMYESDRSSYLEVLLNASSISEFFSKLEYINQMVEYDNHIMEELDACRQVIQESKEAIEATKKELESDKAEEQRQQEQLLTAQSDKRTTLNDLEGNQLALSLMAQEQQATIANLLAALGENRSAIQNEENRLAAIAAEEERRQEQENNNNNNNTPNPPAPPSGGDNGSTGDTGNGGGSDTGSDNGGGSDYDDGDYDDGDYDDGGDNGGSGYEPPTPPVSGGSESDRALPNGYWSTWPGIGNGMLGWPVDSYIVTSLYGPRIHPITGQYSNHGGTDFAADYGQNIYSCGSGTVLEANSTDSWGGGWGYYVLIQHDNGMQTLYAHCSSLNVTTGQRVGTGDVIGFIGSTGSSTGSHLHLEVYVGGVKVDPEDYL